MRDHKFKVGDVVYITSTHATHLRGPFTITKQHKGNGNLYVDGQQFSEWGTSRGGSSWSWLSLVLAGSPEHDAKIQAVRRGNLLGRIANLARVRLPEPVDIDAAEKALDALLAALGQKVQA